MEFSAKTKKILLVIAAVLVLFAVCLYFIADNSGTLQWVSDELVNCGVEISASKLKYEGNAENASIRSLIVSNSEEITQKAIEASKRGGFSTDVDARGNIVLITGEISREEKLTVYIFENESTPMHIEMCFVQNSVSGEVRSAK